MSSFTIVPRSTDARSIRIESGDAAAALNVVCQQDWRDADVLKDGVYSFSARLNPAGMWMIYERPDRLGQDAPVEDRMSGCGPAA